MEEQERDEGIPRQRDFATDITLPQHEYDHDKTTHDEAIPLPTIRHHAENLDLERQTTNASLAGAPAASIHGFDISRVDTTTSTRLPPLFSSSTRVSTHDDPNTNKLPSPPDGGYGWVCVAAVFFVNVHTWGISSSYGVFLAHYLAEMVFPGASSLQYAFVGALSISCGVLISPVAAQISRYCGLTFTLLLGATIESGSLIGASFATKTWQLFLSQGVGFGIGFGLLFVGSVGIVSQWFVAKRSLANGIATAGSGIGGLIYSLATVAMLKSIGQSWTFRVLGILSFVANVVCALLLREYPATPGRSTIFIRLRSNQSVTDPPLPAAHSLQPTVRTFAPRLLKSPPYLLLLLYSTLSMLGYIALLFSLSASARATAHLAADRAALLTALLNLAQGFGRPAVGLASDYIGRLNAAALGTLLSGLCTLIIWPNAHTFAGLVVFAVLCGIFVGTFWATIAPVTAEVVACLPVNLEGTEDPLAILGPALNMLWLVLALPTTFAASIAFELVTGMGQVYLGAELFAGCMLVGASVCLWGLRGWKVDMVVRKREENDEKTGEERRDTGSLASMMRALWAWEKV